MKVVNINLGNDLKEIKIIPISDVHIGDPLCNMKYLKQILEEIKNTPNIYTIINGDMCNTALKNSKSDVYGDEMTPMEQILKLVELLEPIKDKILVFGSGNHEERILKDTSIDVLRLVAKQLGIEDRYTNGWWYLFLRFGEKTSGRKAPMCYQITGYHGSGGGRRSGSKLNRANEMSNMAIADVYIMSHVHETMASKGAIYIPDYANNSLNKKEMNYLITNSFLEDGGYAEKFGLPPKTHEVSEVVLDGTKRKIRIHL